jgi:hypothetical protein
MQHSVLKKLDSRLDELRKTRRRLHKQFEMRRISARDIDAVYEALFLQAVVAFEVYCERMFFAVLTGEIRYSRNIIVCRLGALPEDTARLVVHQGEKYLDWLPWDRVSDRCKLYLEPRPDSAGRPFMDLGNPDTDIISRVVKIRNAIAHASSAAKVKFVKDVADLAKAPPSEHAPGAFLRGTHSPDVTRLENYLDSILTLAVKILGKPKK